MFSYLYHKLMIWYYGWKIRREIRYIRKMAEKCNLPSLDQYTDENILKGFCIYSNYKNN